MAFLIHSVEDGHSLPIEYLPCSAIQPEVGMALTLTSGKLAKATGTTKPAYISMLQAKAALTAGEIIPVVRVTEDIIWETTLQEAGTSLNVGDKVTIHTDAMQVTATTTSGVAEIVYMDGTDAGSMCRVRF